MCRSKYNRTASMCKLLCEHATNCIVSSCVAAVGNCEENKNQYCKGDYK